MMKTKKAQLKKKTGNMIIVIVILVLLLLFANKLFGILNKSTPREICRTGVLAQSLTMIVSSDIISPDCKTYDVVFFNNRVEINGKPEPVLDSRKNEVDIRFNGLTDEIVNSVIAEELRLCWYQFLEGKKSLFEMPLAGEDEDKKLCVLCDKISFDASVKQEEFKGFYEYTQNKEMPGSTMNYYQYYAEEPRICNHYKNPEINCWESYFADEIAKGDESLTPDKTVFKKSLEYVVVFIKKGIFKKTSVLGGKVGRHDSYFAYVVPEDELPNQCNRLWVGPME